jgi:hypothetical protein
MYMRKILVALMLVCALGLFAQIPAGTKSLALSAEVGDFLNMDAPAALGYSVELLVGYFLMDGLELIAGGSFTQPGVDGADSYFGIEGGAAYHYPISPMIGAFARGLFCYLDEVKTVPLDAGVEIFLNPNVAIQVYDEFILNLEEGASNSDYIKAGIAVYIE